MTHIFFLQDDGLYSSSYKTLEYISGVENEKWENDSAFSEKRFPSFRGKNLLFSGQYSIKYSERFL